MRAFLAIIVTVFLFLPGITTAQVDGEGEWRYCPGSRKKCPQVTDTDFKKCIESIAKKHFTSLSDDDFLKISVLDCNKKGIKDIAGIENFTNLVELYLDFNDIIDVSPLAKHTRLTKLYLQSNRINDISPLAGLRNLKEFHIEDNQVENFSTLAKFTELDQLGIASNQVNDLSSLAGLRQLWYLDLSNNSIHDISPLAGLGNLSILYISDNNISNISPLKNLTGLKQLFLNSNNVNDINPLGNLSRLNRLGLNSNQVSDISPLAKLSDLRTLDLSNNSITEISALKSLTTLQRLTLDNNLVSNINPLIGLPNLAHVSLLNNCVKVSGAVFQIEDVSGLEYQHNLCSSPKLVKKVITKDWLDEQTGRQCIEYDGVNDYSLKGDYVYYPDGIYYMYYPRNKQGEPRKMIVCRLPWNSNFENFLMAAEKTVETGKKYTIYRYGNNEKIFVQDGRIKGHSAKWHGSLKHKSAIEEIMEIHKVNYDPQKGVVNGRNYTMVNGKDYVIREIMDGKSHTLQFFQSDFYSAEISKGK